MGSVVLSKGAVAVHTSRQMVFFANGLQHDRGLARLLDRQRPVNILFLTSVRDTGTCDRNGLLVNTRGGPRYMEGVIERTVRKTFSGQILEHHARVVGVITDDREHDMRESDYPVRPHEGRPWIFPHDLMTPDGERLIDRTVHIPSDFRGLPIGAVDERQTSKLAFEQAVYEQMRSRGADILVSDHYMARIEFLIGPTLGLFGKVLNIHPAVTLKDHPFCFRGPTPTKDAILRAQTGVNVKTGATLHVVNPTIDDGPPLAYIGATPVYRDDEPQWLRWRNYQHAKLPLFIAGLMHYLTSIYPYLGRIDVARLHEARAPRSVR